MENDKYFSIYAFTILGALAAVVSASLQAGFTTRVADRIAADGLAWVTCCGTPAKSAESEAGSKELGPTVVAAGLGC